VTGVGNKLFAFRVEINTTHFTLDLVETNVVEPLEAGTCYRANSMVWNQKVFLPAHEDGFSLCSISNSDRPLASLFLERAKSCELGPMTQVNLAICAPILVLCIEAVLGTDDFSFKICRESGMVLS
jgi:hypothetical protein